MNKIVIVLILALLAIGAKAGSVNCDGGSLGGKMACKGMTGMVMAAGMVVLAKDEITHAIMPGKNVEVELDDKSIIPGVLTSKAASGRVVKDGDRIHLSCSENINSKKENSRLCKLAFERKYYPGSLYPKDSEYYGIQPGWSIEVNKDGIPDKNLLVLKPINKPTHETT